MQLHQFAGSAPFAAYLAQHGVNLPRVGPDAIRHWRPRQVDDYAQVFALVDDRAIVAMAAVTPGSAEDRTAWLEFLTVRPRSRGRGLTRLLVRAVFDYTMAQGVALETTGYTEDGWFRLKPVLVREARALGALFVDTDATIGWPGLPHQRKAA